MSKRIAIVTYSLRIGGAENVIFNLGKGFIYKEFKVEIIETLEEGVWKNYFIKNGFKVVSIVKKPFKTAIRHAKQIASYLNGFDIILLNDAPYAQSALGMLKSDILVFPVMHLPLLSMALNATGNKGQWNKIIAVSPLLKDFLLRHMDGLSAEDIVCIPNGIDTNEFSPIKKKNIKKKNILYLGRLSEEKGIRLLPVIINLIRDNLRFDHLDIYGVGPLEYDLKTRVEEFKLLSKINIKGAISHESVSSIIPNYDILIMPSFKEGHPIVLLEAMACGIVPVVTRLEGSTDIVVNHGISGYLCESENTDEFALHLSHALENNNLTGMSEQARKTIENNFSSEIMCNDYIKLFEQYSFCKIPRTNKIDKTLLGDLPSFPYLMVRPVSRTLRFTGLWKKK